MFAAMEALGPDYFRMGDQLDAVMGADQAREFLVEALSLATAGLRAKQAAAQIEDQTRDGKRTPTAAARIALDMADEGLITVETARLRTAGLTAADLTTKGLAAEDGTALIPIAQAATAASGVVSGEIALTRRGSATGRRPGPRLFWCAAMPKRAISPPSIWRTGC